MIKRYGEFLNEEKSKREVAAKTATDTDIDKKPLVDKKPSVKTEVKTKPKKVRDGIEDATTTEKGDIDKKAKNFKKPESDCTKDVEFDGKVATCKNGTKLSETLKFLYDKNIDKNKLLYVMTEQSNNSIAMVKYNRDTKINITEFSKTLINFYMKNEKMSKVLSSIIVEGDNNTVIIKDIPDINIGDKTFKDIIKGDLLKLVK